MHPFIIQVTFDDGEVRLDVAGDVVRVPTVDSVREGESSSTERETERETGRETEEEEGEEGEREKLVSNSSSSSSSSLRPLCRGERVLALCDGWAQHYPGTIVYINDDGTCDINFDDGEQRQGKLFQNVFIFFDLFLL